MEITAYDFDRGSVSIVIDDPDDDNRSTVSVRGNSRSISGSSLAGSRHNEVCKAMSVALQQMITGTNRESYHD